MIPVTREAILARIVVQGGGCWEWVAGRFQQSGYGRMKSGGRAYVAHRLSYQTFIGPIPDGLTLDHLCRNRACVNPAHLEPVTMRVNVLRGNTITARNANKTHCDRGHPLSGDNLFVRNDGRRRCRRCERATQQRLRNTAKYREKHAAYERQRRRKATIPMTEYQQQGDVLIIRRESIPAGAKKVEPSHRLGYVVAHGESGHAHTIEATPEIEMYEKDGTLYLRVGTEAPLIHEEHHAQTVAPGIYEVRRVVEVDPFADEVRVVQD